MYLKRIITRPESIDWNKLQVKWIRKNDPKLNINEDVKVRPSNPIIKSSDCRTLLKNDYYQDFSKVVPKQLLFVYDQLKEQVNKIK